MTIKEEYYIKKINGKNSYEFLLNIHYARRIPSIMFCYGLFNRNNDMVGVITFGMSSNNFLFKLFKTKSCLELDRLCVLDGLQKNVLSWFVSQSLKRIKNSIIISYADPNFGHYGYIYQSTNWLYTGKSRIVPLFIYKNKEYHSRNFKTNMSKLMFKIEKNKSLRQNWVDNGGNIIQQLKKHRYFYITGNKRYKEQKLKILKEKFKILPYPKGKPKRYKITYKPEQKFLDQYIKD